MNISLCTTCCNRLHQFRKTFKDNVQIIQKDRALEWIILNFRSNDGLHEFMLDNLHALPMRAVYAVDTSVGYWHGPIAKNIAMRLGTSEILMSLDCDNYIRDAPTTIRTYFAGEGERVLQMSTGLHGDGTFGRIAVSRSVFERLGGFDEQMSPMGYHDRDFLKRAQAYGVIVARSCIENSYAIRNTKRDSMKNSPPEAGSWTQNDRMNEKRSLQNIKSKLLVANVGTEWGKTALQIFKGGETEHFQMD